MKSAGKKFFTCLGISLLLFSHASDAVPLKSELEKTSLKLYHFESQVFVTGNHSGQVSVIKLNRNLKPLFRFAVPGEYEVGFAAHAKGFGIVVKRAAQYLCYVLDTQGKIVREQVILEENTALKESRNMHEHPSKLFWTGRAYGYLFKHTRLQALDNKFHQGCSLAVIDAHPGIPVSTNPQEIRVIDWSPISHCLDFDLALGKDRIDAMIVTDAQPYIGLTGLGCTFKNILKEGNAAAAGKSIKPDNEDSEAGPGATEDDLILNSSESRGTITTHTIECEMQAIEQVNWPRGDSRLPLNLLRIGRGPDGKLVGYFRRGLLPSATFRDAPENIAGSNLIVTGPFHLLGDNPVQLRRRVEVDFYPVLDVSPQRIRLCNSDSGRDIVIADFDHGLNPISNQTIKAPGTSHQGIVCVGSKVIWLERSGSAGVQVMQKALP